MNYGKIFRTTIELISKVDKVLKQAISFALVDVEGNICYKYDVQTGEYKEYAFDNRKKMSAEWKYQVNAVTESMKSGKTELIYPEQHETAQLKKCYSIACPVKNGESCIGFFCGLMKDKFDAQYGKEIFTAYAKFFEATVQKEIVLEAEHLKNELLQAVLQAIPYGCVIINEEGSVLYANEEAKKYANVSGSEFFGTKMLDTVQDNDLINDVIKAGRSIRDEAVFLKKKREGKELRQAIRTAVPVFNEEGKIIAAVDLIRDMKSVKELVNRITDNKAYYTFDDLIYTGKSMENVIRQAKSIAWNAHPVLIESESGTGKELLAQAIHNGSPRRDGPFVVLDCSAITKELAESEMFGYAPGAFTGAEKGGKIGKVELANEGTLFLDEIGELPLMLQVKLLRFLQSKTFTRVGATTPTKANVRIIAATNRNLLKEIERNNFRLDLYYRLNVFTLSMPPLRERKEDIPTLVDFFIHKYYKEFNKGKIEIAQDALQEMVDYSWPGNVRELENLMIRAMALCDEKIETEHLSFVKTMEKRDKDISPKKLKPAGREKKHITKAEIELALETANYNVSKAAEMLGFSRQTVYNYMKDMEICMPEKREMQDPLWKGKIQEALATAGSNKTEAAKLLGISRKTLYLKMKELEIE